MFSSSFCCGLFSWLPFAKQRTEPESLYEHLASPEDIRLLDLEPGTWTDELRGTLRQFSLGKQLGTFRSTLGGYVRQQHLSAYEAVSYTWGVSGTKATISVNGIALEIPQGGYEALRRLRYQHKRRTLWVDCICINQEDVLERNAQVQRMHDIFGDAQQVVVYVGESVDESEKLLDTLQDMGSPEMRYLESYAKACEKMQTETMTRAIESFLNRRWFSRIWVVQELHFAASAVLVCGDRTIPWTVFQNAVTKWEKEIASVRAFVELPRVLQSGEGEAQNLLPLLQSTRGCGATDPRDKVYAVRNIVRASSIGEVRYDLPVPRVYLNLAIRELEATGSLELLSYVQSDGFTPSWIPDWSNASPLSTLNGLVVNRRSQMAQSMLPAGDASDVSTQRLPKTMDGFKLDLSKPRHPRLHLTAARFGKITELKDPFQRSPKSTRSRTSAGRDRPRRTTGRTARNPRVQFKDHVQTPTDMTVSLAGLPEDAGTYDGPIQSTSSGEYNARGIEVDESPLARTLATKQRDAAYHTLRMMGLPTNAESLRTLFGRSRVDIAYFNVGSNDSLTARSTLVPGEAEPGDVIYYIFGLEKTFVLRKFPDTKSDQAFRLVGECYAPDILNCQITYGCDGDAASAYFKGNARRGCECPESGTICVRKEEIVLV